MPASFIPNYRSSGCHQSLFPDFSNLTCRARKSKPFVDHVLSFTLADSKIWFRNFQIQEKATEKSSSTTDIALLEIGPRFVLTPIIIFEGSGRLADEIASMVRNKRNPPPDPELAEIIADGDLYFLPLTSSAADVEQLTLRLLRQQ